MVAVGLSKIIPIIEDTDDTLASNEKSTLRNSFKMLLFLNFFFLNSTCVKKAKNSIADQINNAMNGEGPGARGGRKGKGNVKYIIILWLYILIYFYREEMTWLMNMWK